MTKYIRVNKYNNPFPQYIPAGERSNGVQIIKSGILGIAAFSIVWLVLWALSYITCVGTYKSVECKNDATSQFIFKLIK